RQTLGYYREHSAAVSTSLCNLVADALRIYQPRFDAAGILVKTRFENSRNITVRKGEMMQVISNLIMNAIQAMPMGGTLTVSVKDEPRQKGYPEAIAIRIADTGPGILPEVLPRVFDAFFSTRQTVGTGIGLFVAKQFVEAHGGRIKIDSSAAPDNHGTTVSVILPVRPPGLLAQS
ncbi:MAG: sensor histidine kinase, partial [Acidobacteriaceae bacterium]